MHTYKLLEKIWKNLSKQLRKKFLIIAIFTVFVAFLELSVAALISLLGVVLTSPQEILHMPVVSTLYNSEIIHNISIDDSMKPLIIILILMVVANIIKNTCAALLFFKNEKLSQTICWEFSQRLLDNYLHASYTWHSQKNSAHLQTHLTWRTSIGIYCSLTLTIFAQLIVTIALVGGAFYLAPFEMLIFFSLATLSAACVYILTKQKTSYCGNQVKQINLDANKLSLSALQGLREVQIYNQHEAFKKAYNNYVEPAVYNTTRLQAYPYIPSWVLESTGILLLLIVVCMMYVSGNDLTDIAGTMALLVAVSWRLLPAMNKVLSNILQLKLYFPQAESVLNDLEIKDIMATPARVTFEKSLALQNISFTYPKTKQSALENISFSIEKGQMIGFVGVSGAGKSTLIALLTGLLNPSTGQILVDDNKVSTGPGYLKVGYVSQSPYLMDASLAVNVAFSQFGVPPDKGRILQCCQSAAMDFLEELPQGIDTVLGERGVRLSGGQIQRVAIARALYSNPDILIFDEATSALDGAAEAAIQKTILSLHKDITIVMIAHRLSTVEACDTIHWLKDGTLYRSGSAKSILTEYETFLKQTSQA